MAKWKLTSTMKCPTPIKEQLDFVQRLSFSQLHRAMIGVLGTSKAWEIKTEDYQWTTA